MNDQNVDGLEDFANQGGLRAGLRSCIANNRRDIRERETTNLTSQAVKHGEARMISNIGLKRKVRHNKDIRKT